MSGSLTIAAALLLGLVASGHCVAMCGGLSAALGLATAKDRGGRPRRALLAGYQAGRIASYALAGLLVGSLGDGLIALLDADAVRSGLRVATGLMLVSPALALLGRTRAPDAAIGRRLWPRIAALGRRLLPVATLPRALLFGMLWGWMPCGFAYSMLLVAALGADPLRSAATMLAFGAGTLPAMLAASWSAPRLAAWSARRGARRAAGAILLACAAWIAAAPWLAARLPLLHGWLPFDCVAAAVR